MMRTGLVSVTFRSLPVNEVIRLAAAAGLDGLEWGGDVHVPHGNLAVAREVGEMTRAADLAVASYGSYYRLGWAGMDGVPAWDDVLASAVALGTRALRVWAGKAGSAEMAADRRRQVIADAKDKAARAAEAGIALSVEYHGQTLTDTNPSTAAFLAEAAHPNLFSLWQPRVGADARERMEGLTELGDRLSHLHVFWWTPTGPEGKTDRRPLAEGAEAWREWLGVAERQAKSIAGERWALLEFVRGESPEQFLADAKVLRDLR